METKKITLLAVFLLALALITGCSGMIAGKNQPPVSAAFVATGTDGIVMTFVPDQPPAKVYTQSPLTFLVEIRNKGTYSTPMAAFYLTGYDPSMMQFNNNGFFTLTTPLEGKSQVNPEGGYTTAEFTAQTVNLPSNMPNYKPTFMLTACYQYKTIATPLVCMDPNPLTQTADKACQVQKVYGTGSQGAPVSVASIESEARPPPTGMFFRIHIQSNLGATGAVFDSSNMAACPGGLQYKDLNVIDSYSVMVSQTMLDCEPKGKLRLVNGQATLFCKGPVMTSPSAYQTPLQVELNYGFKNSIAKQVEIENLAFGR